MSQTTSGTAVGQPAADLRAYPDYFRTGKTHSFQQHGKAFSDGIAQITGGFHAVTFEVLHEIPVAVRASVLANCHRALKSGGILVILDETMPSTLAELRQPQHMLAVQTQYNELIWGNVVPTAEQQEALISGAGFRDIKRQSVAELFTLLTAVK
jgi:hypothetical protein